RFLGLVPGPDFTAHAAAALADTTIGHAQSLLGQLKIANLIQDRGPDRYQSHDLLRRYAIQQCTSTDAQRDRDAALGRLLSLYFQAAGPGSGTTERVRRSPAPPADLATVTLPELGDRASAMAWIEDEFANLQAAVTDGAEHGPYSFAWPIADA